MTDEVLILLLCLASLLAALFWHRAIRSTRNKREAIRRIGPIERLGSPPDVPSLLFPDDAVIPLISYRDAANTGIEVKEQELDDEQLAMFGLDEKKEAKSA